MLTRYRSSACHLCEITHEQEVWPQVRHRATELPRKGIYIRNK